MNTQNDRERILDQLQRGLITADEANIQMVKTERFRVVTKLSSSVRKALNNAVKSGELGHLKKDGLKPEVYFHPTFKYLAIEARNRSLNNSIQALKTVCM